MCTVRNVANIPYVQKGRLEPQYQVQPLFQSTPRQHAAALMEPLTATRGNAVAQTRSDDAVSAILREIAERQQQQQQQQHHQHHLATQSKSSDVELSQWLGE